MIVIGILLEVLAAALGTTSKQLIAYSEYVKKKRIFHLGAFINICIGPVVDASAYAFAPQIVVAPFACLDVIFNALTAPYTLHWQNERLTKVHVLGTGLVAVGAAFTSVFGSVQDRNLTVYELEAQLLQPTGVIYLLVELVAILTMHVCIKMRLLSPTTRGIALGTIAGVLMGNVFFLKGLVGIISNTISTGEIEAWARPTPYICLAAAAMGSLLGHIFMKKGLGEYKGVFMVTIFEGAHITAACLSGCVVMQELAHAPWWQYSLYWCSVMTLVTGMLLINTAAKESTIDGDKNVKTFHVMQSFAGEDQGGREMPIGRSLTEKFPQPKKLEFLPALMVSNSLDGFADLEVNNMVDNDKASREALIDEAKDPGRGTVKHNTIVPLSDMPALEAFCNPAVQIGDSP